MKIKLKDQDLTAYFKEVMLEMDTCDGELLQENLTPTDKSDIKVMIKKEIKDFLDANRGSEFEKKVADIIKQRFKSDKEIEKNIVDITRNVLVQMYKNLWTKRNFWSSDLKNVANESVEKTEAPILNEETTTASVLGSPDSPNYGGFIGPLGRVNKRKLYSRLAYKDGGKVVEPAQGYLREHIYSVDGNMVTEENLNHWFGADLGQKPSWNGGKLAVIEPKCLAFPYCNQGAPDKPVKLIGETKECMCPSCHDYVSYIAEQTGKTTEQIAKIIREKYLG